MDLTSLTAWAAGQTCGCGHTGLTVDTVLVARPIGTWSLSGAQTKASAVETPRLTCPACGATSVAH